MSPHWRLRRQLWDHLDALATSITKPWLLCVDLNVVMNFNERQGGAIMSQIGCDFFQSLSFKHNFINLGFWEPKFTWRMG